MILLQQIQQAVQLYLMALKLSQLIVLVMPLPQVQQSTRAMAVFQMLFTAPAKKQFIVTDQLFGMHKIFAQEIIP